MKIEDLIKRHKKKVKYVFFQEKNGVCLAILHQEHRRGWKYNYIIEIGRKAKIKLDKIQKEFQFV